MKEAQLRAEEVLQVNLGLAAGDKVQNDYLEDDDDEEDADDDVDDNEKGAQLRARAQPVVSSREIIVKRGKRLRRSSVTGWSCLKKNEQIFFLLKESVLKVDFLLKTNWVEVHF